MAYLCTYKHVTVIKTLNITLKNYNLRNLRFKIVYTYKTFPAVQSYI